MLLTFLTVHKYVFFFVTNKATEGPDETTVDFGCMVTRYAIDVR